MNDDLILCIGYVSPDKSTGKVVLKIESGLNKSPFSGCLNGVDGDEYFYYREEAVFKIFKDLLPSNVVSNMDFIISVDTDITEVVIKQKDTSS